MMSAVRCHRRAKGADVEFWTNEQRPILDELPINHLLPYFVDGERSMLDRPRFNGLPTTPNCGQTWHARTRPFNPPTQSA